jgi:hypothetical protein
LRAGELRPRRELAVVAQPVVGPVAPAALWASDELAGLFAPAARGVEEPELPEAGINQDDVDRLFGAAP